MLLFALMFLNADLIILFCVLSILCRKVYALMCSDGVGAKLRQHAWQGFNVFIFHAIFFLIQQIPLQFLCSEQYLKN